MVLCDEFQERLGAAAARGEGGGRGAAGVGGAGLHAAGRGHPLGRHQLRPLHHLQAVAHRQQAGAVPTNVRILALLKTSSISRPRGVSTPQTRRCGQWATRRWAGARPTCSSTRGRRTPVAAAVLLCCQSRLLYSVVILSTVIIKKVPRKVPRMFHVHNLTSDSTTSLEKVRCLFSFLNKYLVNY